MELARKLAREMDAHRTVLGLARVRAERVRRLALAGGPRALRGGRGRGDRRAVRLPARARPPREADPGGRRRTSPSTPTSACRSANSASRRGWSAPTVRVMARPGARPAAGRAPRRREHGQTMIYSTSARVARPGRRGARRGPRGRCSRSAGGACWCRRAEASSVAAATATSCSTTAGSRAATPRSARRAKAGRSHDLGSTNGVLVNGGQVARARAAARRRRHRARLDGDRLRTWMNTLEPVSVALKFGFLAVLYLFLLWVARSARRDLGGGAARGRGAGAAGRGAAGCDRAVLGLDAGERRLRRAARRGSSSSARPGTSPGMIYDLDGDLVLGRGDRRRSASRTRSRPRATRASTSRATAS